MSFRTIPKAVRAMDSSQSPPDSSTRRSPPQARRCLAALALALLLGVVAWARSSASPIGGGDLESNATAGVESPRKRALIVAISNYAPGTGWWSISSHRDVPLVRSALQGQGFSTIATLSDERATRQGILDAFQEILIEPARPGDLVVFHYSGHGQQIPDDGSDEPDGYDEAIVPYDAPLEPSEGYHGGLHLRDDELHRSIRELRRRVGPSGQVVVFLDSCFSGTPRGTVRAQRGARPLGPPAPGRHGQDSGGGFFERPRGRGFPVEASNESQQAPYVVFSAARHNQVAQETLGDDNTLVGSLTWALTGELSRLPAPPPKTAPSPAAAPGPGEGAAIEARREMVSTSESSEPAEDARRSWTYRRLYEGVRWRMAGRVGNQPQIEGDVETRVFGDGVVVPEPYVRVVSVSEDGREVELAAGSLAGLLVSSRVAVHREGTLQPSAATWLADGEVVRSRPTRATVRLEGPAVESEILGQGRAFVTHHALGPLRVSVRFTDLDPRFEQRLRERLVSRLESLQFVEQGADIEIRSDSGGGSRKLVVETSEGVPLLTPKPISSGVEEDIARRLVDYTRNRFFRGLRLRDPALRVELEVIVVRGLECSGHPIDPSTCSGFEDLEPEEESARTEVKTWQPGDLFRLRVNHRGSRAAHLNILNLQPDGVVRLFWPPAEIRDRTALSAGRSWDVPGVFEVTHPEGLEMLLLIASERWIDLTPFVSGFDSGRGVARGDLGPFWPLASETLGQARSAPVSRPGGAHTSTVLREVRSVQDEPPGVGERLEESP